MFRIRKIHDPHFPAEKRAITQAQEILKSQFPGLSSRKIDELPEQLADPLKHRFRATLLVADDVSGTVKGFALLLYASDLGFCFLDFIASSRRSVSGGIGGALYERVRDEARSMGAVGIFFECLPDDPALCRDTALLPQNAARLKFYERFGAFPVVNTAYETPVSENEDCPPYLVLDPLDGPPRIPAERARTIVRAILERKYADYCPPDYIDRVVASFNDDPIALREPRYIKRPRPTPSNETPPAIRMMVNDRHIIHHIRERGYVESPVRIESIQEELLRSGHFQKVPPEEFPEAFIRRVHDGRLVDYLKKTSAMLEPGRTLYPYVFPIRNPQKPPRDHEVSAGYYCIDTFTPITSTVFDAARGAVNCALTAARLALHDGGIAYALVRPPGHHAERRVFGGFCYFNNTAIAAEYLSDYGTVAILDIDAHHGNGQQEIFYRRADVLTISIHGHPSFAYPYFSGFADEEGEEEGKGYNLNLPLPESTTAEHYHAAVEKALARIRRFSPNYLVVALGLDTAKGDPTGTWNLTGNDFTGIGGLIGALALPTVVIQEGGYRTRNLGVNARRFFEGLLTAHRR